MLGGLRFRPRNTQSVYHDGGLLPAATHFKPLKSAKANLLVLVVLCVFLFWVLDPLRMFSTRHSGPEYPPAHPLGSKTVTVTNSKYIYPRVEDAAVLKKLGIDRLFRVSRVWNPAMPEMERTIYDSLNVLDDPNPGVQRSKEDAENKDPELHAINAFKNHEKVVYGPKAVKDQPAVVVVTAIDFEKYSGDYLTKVVQNRVDYAHAHNYGVYVRWSQEFTSAMGSKTFLSDKERAKWVRLYCVRAAMFAFPNAKWIWYLDQDALVANQQVDLMTYLLNGDRLSSVALRERPIVPPNGVIKTYKTLQPDNIQLIFTQSDSKIETNSFIVKNDLVGRCVMDLWGDRLYLSYNNFPSGPDSAIAHVLQWHPFILSKTAIVPARMINSIHSKTDLSENAKSKDQTHYFKGDLVVQWSDAGSAKEAEDILRKYKG